MSEPMDWLMAGVLLQLCCSRTLNRIMSSKSFTALKKLKIGGNIAALNLYTFGSITKNPFGNIRTQFVGRNGSRIKMFALKEEHKPINIK